MVPMKYISVRWRNLYYVKLGNNIAHISEGIPKPHIKVDFIGFPIISISSNKVKDRMNDPFLFQRKNAAELFIVRHADAIPGEDEIIPSGIYDDLPLSSTGR